MKYIFVSILIHCTIASLMVNYKQECVEENYKVDGLNANIRDHLSIQNIINTDYSLLYISIGDSAIKVENFVAVKNSAIIVKGDDIIFSVIHNKGNNQQSGIMVYNPDNLFVTFTHINSKIPYYIIDKSDSCVGMKWFDFGTRYGKSDIYVVGSINFEHDNYYDAQVYDINKDNCL